MKFMEKLGAKKADNRGFSLVELIIVIAIMAILVGIVGAQVVPYLNRSKVAKDQQILSSLLTDAMSAFSLNAEKVSESDTIVLTTTDSKHFTVAATTEVRNTFFELNGNSSPAADSTIELNMSSNDGKNIATITITYKIEGIELKTTAASGKTVTDDLYSTTALRTSK